MLTPRLTPEAWRLVEFIAFLQQVARAHRGGPITLILGNASIHKGKAVDERLAQHPEVELLWLPAYDGH